MDKPVRIKLKRLSLRFENLFVAYRWQTKRLIAYIPPLLSVITLTTTKPIIEGR